MRLKLLLETNRKVYMRFRLAPRSMTLDDLELYKFEFSENFSGFRRFTSVAVTPVSRQIWWSRWSMVDDRQCRRCRWWLQSKQFLLICIGAARSGRQEVNVTCLQIICGAEVIN